jgi:hypothetical protein
MLTEQFLRYADFINFFEIFKGQYKDLKHTSDLLQKSSWITMFIDPMIAQWILSQEVYFHL